MLFSFVYNIYLICVVKIMVNVNEYSRPNLSILNQYIKDLSYENPQSHNFVQSKQKSSEISINMSASIQSYDKDCIGVTLKIICFSTLQENKLFHLELDYFGFFKIIDSINYDQDILINEAVRLIFPFVRSIISNITQNGGSTPILLDNVDFNLLKKIT